MKKLCLVLLSVVLMMVLAVPALAADVELTATTSATTIQTGDEVVVTISISSTTPYTALGVFIEYDKNVFDFNYDFEWGSATNAATLRSFDGEKITATWLNANKYSGELLKIKLKVKSKVPSNTTISFGDLSCKNENADVGISGSSTQVALICEHSYPSEWTKVDNDTHKRICTKCETPDVQNHSWNKGETVTPATCTTTGEKKFTCSGCGETKTEPVSALGHAWDNDCDASCNTCGYTRDTAHKYSEEWTIGNIYHWHKCTSCGETVDSEKHIPGPEATEEAPQVCTVCNFEMAPQLEHVHNVSSEWFTDGDNHWHICLQMEPSCKSKIDLAAHDYDDDCDVSCNTCGYTRAAPHNYKPELQSGLSGHWNVCALCNTHSETRPHTPGAEATDDTPQTCTDCGFILKMQLSHVHEFGEIWYSDNTDHWQSCNDSQCPEVTAKEAHAWNEGEELEDGSICYTCSVCAKQLTLTEPMATEPATPPTAAPTQPAVTKPANDAKDGIGWEWAGIAAIVLLLIGLVLLIIEFIRSRKTNMRGKFSK